MLASNSKKGIGMYRMCHSTDSEQKMWPGVAKPQVWSGVVEGYLELEKLNLAVNMRYSLKNS